MPPATNNAGDGQDGIIGDGVQFAREGKSIAGSIGSGRLSRIEAMGGSASALGYSIKGFINVLGHPSLRVRVDGRVMMACQRCLEPVELVVAVNSDLEMREALDEIEGADDDVDRVLAGKSMDVATLVEDEVLLELPMVARHDACEPINDDPSGAKRASPFAALANRQRR
ncbi:MAG: YceD family protein [Burkholderiales bacterium]